LFPAKLLRSFRIAHRAAAERTHPSRAPEASMTTTLYATFDGEVLRPEGRIPLDPDTRVRVTIEEESTAAEASAAGDSDPYSWLHILESANLDGPPDWSERLHHYLYGEGARSDEYDAHFRQAGFRPLLRRP
jgi:hypothetical protein